MRVMVKFQIPVESGNQTIRTGRIAKFFESIMSDLKPEAAYFFPESGLRAGLFVIDMKDNSEVAGVVERFSFGLNASVELTPVMNGEDLQRGLADIETIVKNYG